MVRTSGIDLVDPAGRVGVDARPRRAGQSLAALDDAFCARSASRCSGRTTASRWRSLRRIATPQVRLTRDPNTFFFFLDHLEDEPPFRLEDDTTWDTNIERGIYWGLRLIDKDEEMRRAGRQAAAAAKPA